VFAQHGIYLTPGDPSRALKIRQFRERLKTFDDQPPMMLIYDTCENFIRTIPLLQMDLHDVEDVDSSMEDHCYDETALMCMGRPISMDIPRRRKSGHEIRIEQLIRGDVDDYECMATMEQDREMRRLWGDDEGWDDLGLYEDSYESGDDGALTDTIL
jgi:hypothetical protein